MASDWYYVESDKPVGPLSLGDLIVGACPYS